MCIRDRLPVRSGMCSNVRRVLFPDSAGGLPQSEITIARALKPQGYTTACIGKWHLGHLPQYLPTSHGFDSYFGIPYSNDMDRVGGEGRQAFWGPKVEYWNVPLMRNEEIVERPADQNTLIQRYSDEAVRFIELCVRGRLNIIIAGGTGSGKTTTLNVLSSFVPENERIITIENVAELQLPPEHVVTLESRERNIEGTGEASIRHRDFRALGAIGQEAELRRIRSDLHHQRIDLDQLHLFARLHLAGQAAGAHADHAGLLEPEHGVVFLHPLLNRAPA